MAEQEKTTPPESPAAENKERHEHHSSHRGRYHRYHGDKKKARQRKAMIVVLILLSAAAVIGSVAALLLKEPVKRAIRPDYSLSELQSAAINGETLYELYSEWGPVHYSQEIVIDLSDKSIRLNFLNPEGSGQEVNLQLCVGEDAIIQTGRLKPGDSVTELELLYRLERQLSAGGYDGKFIVIAYEQESGEENAENLEIPVILQVQD